MKISPTIASTWWRGDKDAALKMIGNQEIVWPIEMEKAFAYGRGTHLCWEQESKITGKIPAIFKVPNFQVMATEKKFFKQLNKEDWLVGKIDVIAKGKINNKETVIIGDYKSGKKTDRWQSCVYHFLVNNNEIWDELVGEKPKQFWYMSMDKLTGETNNEVIKLTEPEKPEDYDIPDATTLTTGENFILTVLDEIKQELSEYATD